MVNHVSLKNMEIPISAQLFTPTHVCAVVLIEGVR
jgi:hypothetical protein